MSDEATQQPGAATPGVRHAALVFSSPPALFRRVEDTGAYGWTLVTLLGLVTLLAIMLTFRLGGGGTDTSTLTLPIMAKSQISSPNLDG